MEHCSQCGNEYPGPPMDFPIGEGRKRRYARVCAGCYRKLAGEKFCVTLKKDVASAERSDYDNGQLKLWG